MTKQASKARQARITSDEAYKAGVKAGKADRAATTAKAQAVEFLKAQAVDGIIPKDAGVQFRLGYIVGKAGVTVCDRDSSDAERARYDGAARTLLSRARKELDTTPDAPKSEKDTRGGNHAPDKRKPRASEPKTEQAIKPQAALDLLMSKIAAKRKATADERAAVAAHLEAVAAFLKLDSGK